MANLARIRKRVLAGIFDYGLIFTLTITYTIAFGEPNEEGGLSVEGIKALPIFALWFLYFPVTEGLTGQTLGKKIVGTRVLKVNGDDGTIRSSIVRHVLDIVDLNFGGLIGIIVIKNTERKQRVGDLVAKTLVVEDISSTCENCRTELILTYREALRGHYVCPKCKHQNTLETLQHRIS